MFRHLSLCWHCCVFCRPRRVWFSCYWSERELWYVHVVFFGFSRILCLCVWIISLWPWSCVLQTSLGKAFSPVFLIAPVQIMTWLNQYHDHCQQILSQIKYETELYYISVRLSGRAPVILTSDSKYIISVKKRMFVSWHLSLLFFFQYYPIKVFVWWCRDPQSQDQILHSDCPEEEWPGQGM